MMSCALISPSERHIVYRAQARRRSPGADPAPSAAARAFMCIAMWLYISLTSADQSQLATETAKDAANPAGGGPDD